ncbi:MAG: histidine triad nucleotide-binding protein [Rhodoferax sp.]|nr:histidine triad nucleotide-binding protein [Actinomycetota bacterium]
MSTEPRRDRDCLFCRIVAGEVPADVVGQDERVMAFRDVTPQAPVHVLVVPREHHADVATLAVADPDALVALVRMGSQIAQDEVGGQFRLVFNSGPDAGQSVYHVHGHVLGGRSLTWPPG